MFNYMKKILLFVIAINIISLAQESVTIAVLKLRPSGIQESEAEILTDYVRSILVEMNLYQVVDRGKMNEILKEQEFQLSGCTSTECAVEVGELLGVQKMLTGSVGKFGKLFTIELRMINIETGRIEKSSRYNYEGPIEQLLTEGIQNAIKKLVQVHKLEDLENEEDVLNGKLSVSSEPSGAIVFINDLTYGKTPLNIDIPAGLYVAKLKKEGFIDYTEEIRIRPEKTCGIQATLISSPVKYLIKGDPEGADIYINGKHKGKAPLMFIINPGRYKLKISKKGYISHKGHVIVPMREGSYFTYNLQERIEVKTPAEDYKSWKYKFYIQGGLIEPWGDPGTGAIFDMGKRAQFGAQLNIGKWVSLPTVLHPLTAEVMVGYGMWNIKDLDSGGYIEYFDAKTKVISVLAIGRYDVTDLILNLIGFEYPVLGIFGVAGFQYNTQSWDFPDWDREFDSASSFGLNLGLGVKYNLQSMVGKPVEIDLRFTQGVFLMGEVNDKDGYPFFDETYYPESSWYKDTRDYSHAENGLLLGIAYPF
ncbi:MAG: PEGA domain-containing protein [Candidatus Marinimicrobia bacterium]|nr:PEGA domain-containing protein [Candidatus Neomarinimicrobiota bacterium]